MIDFKTHETLEEPALVAVPHEEWDAWGDYACQLLDAQGVAYATGRVHWRYGCKGDVSRVVTVAEAEAAAYALCPEWDCRDGNRTFMRLLELRIPAELFVELTRPLHEAPFCEDYLVWLDREESAAAYHAMRTANYLDACAAQGVEPTPPGSGRKAGVMRALAEYVAAHPDDARLPSAQFLADFELVKEAREEEYDRWRQSGCTWEGWQPALRELRAAEECWW